MVIFHGENKGRRGWKSSPPSANCSIQYALLLLVKIVLLENFAVSIFLSDILFHELVIGQEVNFSLNYWRKDMIWGFKEH